MDVNWGIDYEPFKDSPGRGPGPASFGTANDCFNLTIEERFSGRNKSEINITSCFAWTLTAEGNTSGMAMLIVDIPSGYIMLQPDANRIVKQKEVPQLKDIKKQLSMRMQNFLKRKPKAPKADEDADETKEDVEAEAKPEGAEAAEAADKKEEDKVNITV